MDVVAIGRFVSYASGASKYYKSIQFKFDDNNEAIFSFRIFFFTQKRIRHGLRLNWTETGPELDPTGINCIIEWKRNTFYRQMGLMELKANFQGWCKFNTKITELRAEIWALCWQCFFFRFGQTRHENEFEWNSTCCKLPITGLRIFSVRKRDCSCFFYWHNICKMISISPKVSSQQLQKRPLTLKSGHDFKRFQRNKLFKPKMSQKSISPLAQCKHPFHFTTNAFDMR